MEGFSKVVLILSVFLGVLAMDVNGGRTLKTADEVVDHPQTFPGFGGTTFPSPGLGGSFPSPGLGGSFPSPGLGGSFPSPGLGGSFPSPGLGGSFPSPGLGGSFPSPSGPSSFCTFPGVRCSQVQPNSPSDSSVNGSP